MQFIKPDVNIEFIGRRKIGFLISTAMILISIVSLVIHQGPKLGIDFAGGTMVLVKYSNSVSAGEVKTALKNTVLEDSTVQRFGTPEENEFLIRSTHTGITGTGFKPAVEKALSESTGEAAEILSTEMVGPQVGHDLREKALFAMFYALLFITIYISGRFEYQWLRSAAMAAGLIFCVYVLSRFAIGIPMLIGIALVAALVLFWFLELKYAMGAIVALIHDVTITAGIFSIFDIEFSLPIIAALLTIIGYSLNDTIIVFDRIRENLRKYSKKTLEHTINRSINETLSRTILTSLTTLVVLISLFALGGGIIHDFSLAMIIGIVIGTYSSIFVASPILVAWQQYGKK